MASDNGLSPCRGQAIIWNNAGILSFGLLGTNFSEILIEILTFSFKKMCLKVSSAKWWPFCHGLNVLNIKNHWKTNLVQQPVTTEIHCYFNHFVDVHCRNFILFKCAPNAGLSGDWSKLYHVKPLIFFSFLNFRITQQKLYLFICHGISWHFVLNFRMG